MRNKNEIQRLYIKHVYTDLYKCVFNFRLKVSGETILRHFISK